MSTLLTLEGKPVGPVATEAKLQHDPETLAREKSRLGNLLKSFFQGWMHDRTPDPNKPNVVHPDPDALRAHWGGRWAEAARTMNESSTPIRVDEDALYKMIDERVMMEAREAESSKGMHEILDMSTWEFLPVSSSPVGMLYINSACAVAVDQAGYVYVWVRHALEDLEQWAEGWRPITRKPLVTGVSYSMAELYNLLQSIRVGQVATLSEELMMRCRTKRKSPWWQMHFNLHVVQLLGWLCLLVSVVVALTIGLLHTLFNL